MTLLQETGGSFLKNALCWTRSGFPRVGSWESKFATYSIVLWESGFILLDKTFLYRKSKWLIYYGTSQVLTRRRIWLTWFLKLIGPQTPLYSIPTEKKKPSPPSLFTYLEMAVLDQDSASPSQQTGGLFLQCYWKGAIPACLCVAYGHILSRIIAFQRYPHAEIWDTHCSIPNKGGGVGAVKVTLGNFPMLLYCSNVTTIAFKSIYKIWASSSHTNSRIETESNH